jgi:hypothetical protein
VGGLFGFDFTFWDWQNDPVPTIGMMSKKTANEVKEVEKVTKL